MKWHWHKIGFYILPPLLALLLVFKVDFKTDLSAFILAAGNAEEVLLASEMQTGKLSRRYLVSIGSADKSIVSNSFIQALNIQLSAIDGVQEVWSPGQQNSMTQSMLSIYGQFGSSFYSLNPALDLPAIFSDQGLQQRAKLLKQLLLSPQASMFKKLALQDPLLLTLNGFESVAGQMQQTVNQTTNYENLIIETTMTGLDAPEQSRIQKEIQAVFNDLKQSTTNNYELEMTGVPVFAVATQNLIQGDITKISIISSVILMLMFLLIFRSLSAMMQVFTLLMIVILSAILSTQLVFGTVHGMTVAIGSTLIGICIDYPIHAIAHAQAVIKSNRVSIVSKIWPSMLLGGLTTMIGYIALGISGYPGFQQVAVYASTGIIVSLLLTRFVLPSLISVKNHQTLRLPMVTKWARFCYQYRLWLLMILVLVLSAGLAGLKSLHWMQDMQELTPELDYLKQNDKRIRSRMTSIEPGRFVMLTGNTVEAALQKAEQVYPILDKLKQQDALSDYFAIYPWLLSAQKQQQNQIQLQQYLTSENKTRWQQALKQQGLSTKRLGNLNYSSHNELTFNQVLKTPVSKLIDSRIISTENQTIIIIWLSDHQPKGIKQAMQTIDGAQYFSQRELLNNMTKDYTERAQVLLSIGLAIIILLLFFRYKNIIKAVTTLLPAIIAAFLILSLWSFTGEAISFLHLVGFLLVVAICVDYGIFYQENRGEDIALTYQAMAASMLTSAIAFGSLMAAESTSLNILASVVAIGVVLGFLLCPLIIKSKPT